MFAAKGLFSLREAQAKTTQQMFPYYVFLFFDLISKSAYRPLIRALLATLSDKKFNKHKSFLEKNEKQGRATRL